MAPSAAVFLFLTCVLLPWLSIKSARAANAGAKLPNFRKHLLIALGTQAYMLAMAMYTAHDVGIVLFPSPRLEWRFVGVGAVALAVLLGTLPIRRRLVSDVLKRRLYERMPHYAGQMWGWTGLAAVAGFGEEIVFRGVLFQILYYKLEHWWLAALIASAVFAVAHIIQGRMVALWIFAFSIGFHGLVRYCGDLYTAMIVHFVYDAAIGYLVGFVLKPTTRASPPV
jgi:membrane protease YdiL (CAAX protease family)